MNNENDPTRNPDPVSPSSPPPAPGYATPPPQAPPAQPGYSSQAAVPQRRTNILAILALIFGIVFPIVGIILGHISLSQIKKTGEEGRGMALAGTIIGYVLVVLGILFFILYIAVFAFVFSVADPTVWESY